jgi:hypothetical protein
LAENLKFYSLLSLLQQERIKPTIRIVFDSLYEFKPIHNYDGCKGKGKVIATQDYAFKCFNIKVCHFCEKQSINNISKNKLMRMKKQMHMG